MNMEQRQMESRIKMLESTNVSLKRELSMVHPIYGISPQGKRKSSLEGAIWANENEIKNLRQRLSQIGNRNNIAR